MKNVVLSIAIILFGICTNFGIFLYAYRKLAFPYLHEAQRMENAPYIFGYVLLAFICSSILLFLIQRLVATKNA